MRRAKLVRITGFGFQFLPEEESILLKVFNIGGSINSGDEMLLLYKALSSMAKQADQMQLEFAEEIKIMCKSVFLKKFRTQLNCGIGKIILM